MEISIPGHLAGWDIHGFHTLEDLDIEKIKEESMTRWLRSNEIYAILCNYSYFNIKVKPVDLPTGGTIVLFDRKMLRNFRKDGHNWKKKKDGKTVKEAHEHLKVGDRDRVHVYYAHGQDNPKFVRRIYWLLDKKHEHIVVVHYREVLEDNATQCLAPPMECKETLTLSNRMQFGSPFTPVNSVSGSLHSETSGSRILGEETDSATDGAFYAGSGTSPLSETTELGNPIESTELGNELDESSILRLHEINTLEWADLLANQNNIDYGAPIRNEASCFDQQSGYMLRDSKSNGSLLQSHNLSGGISSFVNPTNITTSSDSVGSNQTSSSYFPVGDQYIQLPVGTDETLDMFENNELQTQDSFGRWMTSVVNESAGSLDNLPNEHPVFANNEMSADSLNDLPNEHPVFANHESGAPSVMEHSSLQEPVFSITDISPGCAFSTEETKVIVIGYFHEPHARLAESNLFFVIGDTCVPAEMLQAGAFRCIALPHRPGLVNLYLTLDGQTPISQVLNFEYRSIPSNPTNNGMAAPEKDNSNWEELQVQLRLAHLLFSTTNSISLLSSKISSHAMAAAKKFASITPNYEKDWINFMKSFGNNQMTFSQANHNLFELTLKEKLREWLLEKVVEGCKRPTRDDHGQGVIHLCAILGYAWAVYPFSRSGLSIDFRDAFGWTALHWAAYCGREQMVAFLLSAGANPSLVTDPNDECLGGYTSADLASIKGYDGLAAYLAEKGLTAHFRDMTLSGNASGSLQANGPDPIKDVNLDEDELCLKDSLAAYRTAANAAACIQSALREHSLKLRTKAIQTANPEIEALVEISAIKIQHAFRNYKSRKRMVAALRIQHGFRTWKIRKDFLNMRQKVIRVQAAFRGHLVRRQYRKILWSIGVLEKAILRWRLKRKGLRGLQVEETEAPVVKQDQENSVEEDFYLIGRKHTEERVERSVIRVQSMFRSHQAQKEYRRMKVAFDQAQLEYDELLGPSQP
ncbi:calmodulin-binding transcription activator isoform X2 [Tasmannia lanceolata]|uniref:calmodulin-binding transcription activator isoform X2 n=1 Tax=Tasmannia lanceolata TaxID=3420 RepID=UPI0040639394